MRMKEFGSMVELCRWWLSGLVAALMVTACAVGGDDTYAAEKGSDAPVSQAVYEGEWTVNRQVVDTARLVVGPTLHVRLPESYLMGLCTSVDKSGMTALAEPLGVAAEIRLVPQGYSEQSQYMAFASPTLLDANAELRFNTSSFSILIDGRLHRVSLLCPDNANAVMQTDMRQWTLGITVSALLVTDTATGQSVEHKLPVAVTIYYNTKRRIG